MNLAEALKNQKTRKRLCYHRFDLFLLYYLRESFPVPFSPKHFEMIKLLQEGNFEEFIAIGHRNFGKTLIMKGYLLWLICYSKAKFIVIASHEGKKAASHAFDIGLQLQINKRILNDFGQLYWKEQTDIKRKDKKRQDNFLTTNNIFLQASASSIRGLQYIDEEGTHRPDVIFYDDIETLKTVESYAVTQKIIRDLGESKNAKAIGGKSLFAINRLSKQGVAGFLESRVGKNTILFEAKLINSKLVQDKANILESAKKNLQWKARYVATDKQKEIINKHSDYSVESVENLLKDGMSVFMREYQNEPLEDLAYFVKPEDIKNNYYTVEERDWKVCIAIDPQSGMTAKSDEFAITVVGYKWRDPHRFVLEQVSGRASPTQQAKLFIELMLKYYDRLEKAGVEVVKTQTAVYLTILDWVNHKITIDGLPKCDKEFPVMKLTPIESKETRLNRFVPAFERGEIHLKPDMLELEEQLIYFTNLPHDDKADSLLSCLELIKTTKAVYNAKKIEDNYDSTTVFGNMWNKQF